MEEENYFNNLLKLLIEKTRKYTDDKVIPIVDDFINKHPDILNKYEREFLYII
jgi:hypothetical protein